MDFVDWCGFVLKRMIDTADADIDIRLGGQHRQEVFYMLFEQGTVPWDSPQLHSVGDALDFLQKEELLRESEDGYIITSQGRDYVNNPTELWEKICQIRVPDNLRPALKAVNRLSQKCCTDYANLETIESESLLKELGDDSEEASRNLLANIQELHRIGIVTGDFYLGIKFKVTANFRGLIWETRRGLVFDSKRIDELVNEWETTSVDFKREQYLDTKDQKAEFIKDVLGLANTQASGARLLIIGFDDKTRLWHSPPDPKLSQNRIEQVLAEYTEPTVEVRYKTVDYRDGLVGQLQIKRDPTKLPYRVAKSIIGEKKRIEEGNIFVRHGSQTESPTEGEGNAIRAEGERARRLRDERLLEESF